MEKLEPPKEILDMPALELAWNGLSISISEGVMTRKEAYQMLQKWSDEQTRQVVELDE